MIKTIIFLSAFLLLQLNSAFAQSTFLLSDKGSSLKVTGTSSLHDWEMNLGKMEGSFTANPESSTLKSITGASFKCRAESLLSNNSIMDRKAHDALRANSYPEISFSNTVCDKLTVTGGKINGSITGDLRLAGKSKRINLHFEGTFSNQTIIISGSYAMRMSDFGISPPAAMLGTLKTGDEIKITFRLEFLAGVK